MYVYPVPVVATLHFTMPCYGAEVRDCTGRLLLYERKENLSDIDVSSLQPGMYTITILRSQPMAFRFLKE
jgi:hypothetical protein